MTGEGWHSTIAALAVAVLSVAAVTGAPYGLREFAPPISTGVVFLLPVLLVSSNWGVSSRIRNACSATPNGGRI